MIRCVALAMVVVLAFSAGCRRSGVDQTVKVTGVVTLDGKPCGEVLVMFYPTKGRPASGTTDSEGRFSLSTFARGDGAIPGQHTVAITEAAAGTRRAAGASSIACQCSTRTQRPLR